MFNQSWPRAILLLDGDAFFASCEQAVDPALLGKPVVTGKERNIVSAASYEARALGITRGVTLWDAKKRCPQLVVLPSDYETYSIFSKRVFEIMRRYTPTVEEYSIDEGFADLTGLRRLHHLNYRDITKKMQLEIHKELGITVSAGLSITKTLAKIAAKKQKPAGFTAISGRDLPTALSDLLVGDIWNIGPSTAELLNRFGIKTAEQFAGASLEQVGKILTKPGVAVWNEINGRMVYPVAVQQGAPVQSISKMKTFTPPSNNKSYVYSQLMKNLDNACAKARRHLLLAKKIIIVLRKNDFRTYGLEAKLSRPSAFPLELSSVVEELFMKTYEKDIFYRATGVLLVDLMGNTVFQPSLFDDTVKIEKILFAYRAIDELREKYGKYVICQGSALSSVVSPAHSGGENSGGRCAEPDRKKRLLKGETKRRHLPLPLFRGTV
jgi:DNA polymerase-4/DNA polymerase V